MQTVIGSLAWLASTKQNGQGMIPTEFTADKSLVLVPEGRLDSSNVGAAETDVFGYLDGGYSRVVFDCARLDYISSAGLRLVLVTAKRLKQAGGKLALCGMKPHIREVFDISGFASILTIVDSRQEAEAAVGG
jgi:stage II sporulation protein AA (anti-sigma F factor antagonist)